jgi:hypothetical protein
VNFSFFFFAFGVRGVLTKEQVRELRKALKEESKPTIIDIDLSPLVAVIGYPDLSALAWGMIREFWSVKKGKVKVIGAINTDKHRSFVFLENFKVPFCSNAEVNEVVKCVKENNFQRLKFLIEWFSGETIKLFLRVTNGDREVILIIS